MVERLINIKNSIEIMNTIQQKEVFKIINNNGLDYNENKNGIFVNLTNVNNNIICELEKYIAFVKNQNTYLIEQEAEKEKYLENYFKENTTSNISDEEPKSPNVNTNSEPAPVLYAN